MNCVSPTEVKQQWAHLKDKVVKQQGKYVVIRIQ